MDPPLLSAEPTPCYGPALVLDVIQWACGSFRDRDFSSILISSVGKIKKPRGCAHVHAGSFIAATDARQPTCDQQ